MEDYLSQFEVKSKNSSEEALARWRKLCMGMVKNRKRRFRNTANLPKRAQVKDILKQNKEKLKVALLVSKAAFHFIDAGQLSPYTYDVPDDVKSAGFVCALVSLGVGIAAEGWPEGAYEGTKVQDGSGNILVTTVGMRTGWGSGGFAIGCDFEPCFCHEEDDE
ncbi:hypothetical protein KI387_024384 [Taxus chinensis]|uniref:Calcium-transporting P-type ATPase N-terminal autoinhibitory domain-containing protein n=1 Tax=Taxus chinensis TaxID=29808 RepID=A0AA38LCR0_TAXCH|nr:hypothetical protein KI387_024384 [Taxus chinensis]